VRFGPSQADARKPQEIPAKRAPFKRHRRAAAALSRETQIGSLAMSSEARPEGLFALPSAACRANQKEEKTDDEACADLDQEAAKRFARHKQEESWPRDQVAQAAV